MKPRLTSASDERLRTAPFGEDDPLLARLKRQAVGYPADWPRCPVCNDFALDGHITCGRLECNENEQRRKQK